LHIDSVIAEAAPHACERELHGSYKVLTRLSVGFALVSPLAALMLAGFPAQ
jgi:hypothetical protein